MGNGVDRGEPCSRPTTDYDYDGFLANFSKVGWGMGRCDLMKTRTFERPKTNGEWGERGGARKNVATAWPSSSLRPGRLV